mgnify:CR=1 FL=1
MFNLVKQVINFQDTLYIVKRIVKEENIKNKDLVQDFKEWIGADTVLKKDNLFYFVNKVEEAQVVEYL